MNPISVTDELRRRADEPFGYVTTTGRRTGRPHEIEIWFWLDGTSLYLLAEGRDRADWVRNMRAQPMVRVRLGDLELAASARFALDREEEASARRMMAAKYQGWQEGAPMSDWALSALPVALDLTLP